MNLSFSRLWDGYATDKEALQARNLKAKELKRQGYSVMCWRLPNQLKKYDGLGIVNGGICHVYKIDYVEIS